MREKKTFSTKLSDNRSHGNISFATLWNCYTGCLLSKEGAHVIAHALLHARTYTRTRAENKAIRNLKGRNRYDRFDFLPATETTSAAKREFRPSPTWRNEPPTLRTADPQAHHRSCEMKGGGVGVCGPGFLAMILRYTASSGWIRITSSFRFVRSPNGSSSSLNWIRTSHFLRGRPSLPFKSRVGCRGGGRVTFDSLKLGA